MPTTYDLEPMIDNQQAIINSTGAMLDGVTTTEPTVSELLDEALVELDAAQAALDEAKAAMEEDPPNEALAREKLAESVDHTIKALDLIKRALGIN